MGPAGLPYRTPAMRTFRAALAVFEIATDPALSVVVFEPTVRKLPKSWVVALGRYCWRPSFLEQLGNTSHSGRVLLEEKFLRQLHKRLFGDV